MKRMTIVSLFVFALACKNGKHADTNQQVNDSTEVFFPVADYLKSEIREVDSLPVAITKYTIQNKHTDSSYIKMEEFHQLAKEFLPDELNIENFQKNFSENSFFDQTTGSSTFTYSTKNDQLELQRVDVIAEPTGGYDKIKSVYMEKVSNLKDTVIVKKLFWVSRKNFQIITERRRGSAEPEVTQIKVLWNYWE